MRQIKLSFLILALLSLNACKDEEEIDAPIMDTSAKQEMREFVIGISTYAKILHPGFAVIPQNGIELVTENGDQSGNPSELYLAAIDGNGQEDLFFGYHEDDEATPFMDTEYLKEFLSISQSEGNTILVTDYCSTPSNMDESYNSSTECGFISFAADERELNNIPGYPTSIYMENTSDIASLAEAQNFLYLINPMNFSTKQDFVDAVAATNYDLIIMDLFFHDGTTFSSAEINQLQVKENGGSRLVIAYMSIGEAEDYRYYWQAEWATNPPTWLDEENPDWEGNYKVKYWDVAWQNIIFGNDDSYLKKIIDADFDGVYLDIIDAFEYYE